MIFIGMAGMALFATIAVFLCGIEPRSLKPLQAQQKDSQSNFLSTWRVFQIPSFQIVLAAGIVGAAHAPCLCTFHGASSLRYIMQASLRHLGRGGNSASCSMAGAWRARGLWGMTGCQARYLMLLCDWVDIHESPGEQCVWGHYSVLSARRCRHSPAVHHFTSQYRESAIL